MAIKKSATQSSSRSKKHAAVSRKTLRPTSAPLARKSGDDDKSKKDQEGAAEPVAEPSVKDDAAGAAKAGDTPAADAAGASALPDAGPAPASEPAMEPAAEPASQPAAQAEDRAPAAAPAAAAPEASLAELLAPDDIQAWDPASPAPPPGKTPPGDSRSFRRIRDGVEEFVLIYRSKSYLVTRAGTVGTMGTWSVVEYPHIGAAANAYAHKCSHFTNDGYRDL